MENLMGIQEHPEHGKKIGKGFYFVFKNGVTVSVQFGPGNYCSNRHKTINECRDTRGVRGTNAAVLAWKDSSTKDKLLLKCPYVDANPDGEATHVEPEQVARILAWAADL